jgi:hypothetical protein
MFNRFTTLVFVPAVFCVAATADAAGIQLYSDAFGNCYVASVTGKDFDKTPDWSPDAENPPVSAKKAISLATKMKDSLAENGKNYKWVLDSAALHRWTGNKWYWVATYEVQYDGPRVGPNAAQIRIVVLMDGTAVRPEVSRLRGDGGIVEIPDDVDEKPVDLK